MNDRDRKALHDQIADTEARLAELDGERGRLQQHLSKLRSSVNSTHIGRFSPLARKLNLESNYLARIHKLIFLAPDIQLAILEGRQPPDLTLDRLSK